MKVSELGEFGLIELLSDIVSQQCISRRLLVGIGDDAAAWQVGDATVLATTDTMVQGIHFTSECTWGELGWKAVAINLSDIAAMGGIPQFVLVSLSIPDDTEVDDILQLYKGIGEAAEQFEVAIAGGNISSSPTVAINLAAIGQARDKAILTRSAAMPGDLIAVTGYLGSAAAGYRMLSQHLRLDPSTMTFLRRAHLQPQPRLGEGQLLVASGVRAAIDISDGLIADLSHLCKASMVKAEVRVDWIPLHPVVRDTFGVESLHFALTGGEDYELLFAAKQEIVDAVRDRSSCPITVVGEILEGKVGEVVLTDEKGEFFHLGTKGWEHFV